MEKLKQVVECAVHATGHVLHAGIVAVFYTAYATAGGIILVGAAHHIYTTYVQSEETKKKEKIRSFDYVPYHSAVCNLPGVTLDQTIQLLRILTQFGARNCDGVSVATATHLLVVGERHRTSFLNITIPLDGGDVTYRSEAFSRGEDGDDGAGQDYDMWM